MNEEISAKEMISEYHYSKGQLFCARVIVFIVFCGLLVGETGLVVTVINMFAK